MRLFTSKLHSVLTQDDSESIIVFSNGCIQPFSAAIHSRKNTLSPVLQPDETIVDVQLCGLNLVALIASSNNNQDLYRLHLVSTNEDTTPVQIDLKNEDLTLKALSSLFVSIGLNLVALIASSNNNQDFYRLHLVSTNEDTRPVQIDLKNEDLTLVSYCIIANSTESTLITFWSNGNICSCKLGLQSTESEFPGPVIMNIKTIKTSQPIAMKGINANLLVLYGCDPGEEGALLLVIDTRLRAVVCRHYFKMYTKPPRLWVIQSNIVLSMGQYLALVPFQMTSQLLDTRIKTQLPDEQVTKTVHWEKSDGQQEDSVSYETYEDKFRLVLDQKENMDSLLKTLESCAEVPDSCLLQCIKVILNNPASMGTDLFLKVLSFPPPKSAKFKNSFDFESSVEFLTYILDTGYALVNGYTSEWTTCIIDAYYHRFLLCEDKKTQEILQDLHSIVQLEVNALLELSEIRPKLERRLEQLNRTNKDDGFSYSSSKSYSYEILKLY
ncbi:uncharacterized protein LOC103518779 [Diaphorina citri]|uniref:Uncharacterized protein LOC103518779 n=1 Tax=Diaphorina citri TaxID=121845 RepID=A0A3Q0JCQ3_DIACI|nr:uncharacterized protein LOC103518779 [Diaphorina citri]